MTTDLIAAVSLGIAIVSFIDASLQRFSKRTTSKYAAQRDFEHLRRNQEQIVEAVRNAVEEFDEVREEIRDVKRIIEVYLGISGKLPFRPTKPDSDN